MDVSQGLAHLHLSPPSKRASDSHTNPLHPHCPFVKPMISAGNFRIDWLLALCLSILHSNYHSPTENGLIPAAKAGFFCSFAICQMTKVNPVHMTWRVLIVLNYQVCNISCGNDSSKLLATFTHELQTVSRESGARIVGLELLFDIRGTQQDNQGRAPQNLTNISHAFWCWVDWLKGNTPLAHCVFCGVYSGLPDHTVSAKLS